MMSIRKFSLLILALFFVSACDENEAGKKKIAVFSQDHNRLSWSTSDLGLPSDWSEYNYLVLDMKASSPQRFSLGLATGRGFTKISVLPFQNARIEMVIPLRFFRKANTEGSEMAALYSRGLTTGWFNVWGVKVGPLNKVDSLIFQMGTPLDCPQITLYGVRLTQEKVTGKIIEPKILVDQFGQWIPDNTYPRIKNTEELKAAWQKDDSLLQSQKGRIKRDIYGGFTDTLLKATGFFRTEKVDGKWWFVDPEGHLTLITGINGVSPGDFTRTDHRSYIFEQLPPEEFQRKKEGHEPWVSFGLWNQQRHYGNDWKNEWKSYTLKRMKTWGFNAINWSVPYLNDKMVYCKFLYGWGIEEGIMGFPDVYSEAFEKAADSVAANQCMPLKDDPWMLGYFLGNEPVFPGDESLVVDAFLKGPDTKTKVKLKAYLAEGDTRERRIQFVHDAYRHFLDVAIKAIRRYDKNHLILGMRYGNLNISDDVIKMARVFDVFSFNRYIYTLPKNKLDHVYELLDMPILVGEFHFGVPGRGLAEGLAQVANQHERGVAYRNYVENAFAHPAVVATFWYRWRDQPVTGRDDGENYNIGMVDVTDCMYPDLVEAAITTHQRVRAVHLGEEKPYSQLPEGRWKEEE